MADPILSSAAAAAKEEAETAVSKAGPFVAREVLLVTRKSAAAHANPGQAVRVKPGEVFRHQGLARAKLEKLVLSGVLWDTHAGRAPYPGPAPHSVLTAPKARKGRIVPLETVKPASRRRIDLGTA